MGKRNYIYVILLLLFILSLNISFAADENIDPTISHTPDNLDYQDVVEYSTTKQESNNIVYVDSKSDSDIEDGSNESPFKTINNENLEQISDDSTIYVSEGEYELDLTYISKNLSIIGENKRNTIFIPINSGGFTIDEGVNVEFKDFTIKNHSSDFRPAIINNGNLSINNLYLLNNVGTTTKNNGGAILNNGNLMVNNCNFENNTASFGAAIYNTKELVITKSTFVKNNIYNVGGAIYSLKGNLTVIDSEFINNRAVSGAAIYNAAGYLYVDNTDFYQNDAEKFFGGAIYSTGITITNNSYFLSNHASIDGGAITTTNEFTIINCIFEQNSATTNGGAIENVPWATNEIGKLTILNSEFKENSAGVNGGAIINYKKPEFLGEIPTVIARNCIFDSNSASDAGGLVYNELCIDFQYNVIKNHDSDKNKTIYSDSSLIKSIENNWWGTNTPTQEEIGAMPETWIVMNFTNKTALVKNLSTSLEVSLNTLNNGQSLESEIPERRVRFSADSTVLPEKSIKFTDKMNITIEPLDDVIYAQIDDQLLSLDVYTVNLSYSFVNDNRTLQINLEFPENVKGKTSVKINSVTIFDKVKFEDGSLTLNYDIPNEWIKKSYTLSVVALTTDNNLFRMDEIPIEIPERTVNTTLTIINYTPVKVGTVIELVASVELFDEGLNTGKVAFKINGNTIQTNVKLVDGTASIYYVIPTSFKNREYTITLVYSGDENKLSSSVNETLVLEKLDVFCDIADEMSLNQDTDYNFTIKLYDDENDAVNIGKACYKINYITVQTNITVIDGEFLVTFRTPELKNNTEISQILTLKYGGNNNYNSWTKDIKLSII